MTIGGTAHPALGTRFVDALAARDHDGMAALADRGQLRFRLRGRNADGPFVVEQQAYIAAREDRIGWMRVVCSGFRPAGTPG